MLNILLVGLGGALGSISRYLVSGWVQTASKNINFPFGTLAVNLAGCFVIGFLAHLAEARGIFSSETRSFVFIGILGGFTTFSSFGNETLNLLRSGEMLSALTNIGTNVIFGLAAVWLGRTTANLIWK